jgi:two-component system cell cycle sensor histidine kinase/response regulator CckA
MTNGGGKAILIADDEGILREMLKEMLQKRGYEVFDAGNGECALRVFQKNSDRIQLLILDVMMPKMNGKEVYLEIKKVNPDIKTIFISGYPSNIIDTMMTHEKEIIFIAKPFVIHEFLEKIRETLDT